MEFELLEDAVKLVEKANANLDPELLDADRARATLQCYAKLQKLATFGVTALALKLDDAAEVARMTGTSMGKARTAVDTGKVLSDADEVRAAFQDGDISLDQASEIAKAELACPGSATELLEVAAKESFQVLRDKARKTVLEVEQHRGLAQRQHEARSARSHTDELGMIHIDLTLEPHVGVPLVNRSESEASRLYRRAKKERRMEPFGRFLADAYAALLSGATATKPAGKPELVVLVSHEVTQRGWKDVLETEVCKIPGVGPLSPAVAKDIAQDAFLTGLFYDGVDLRHLRRWTRNTPIEVLLALQLGDPPQFDGVKCSDCGKRFRTEDDHLEPHVAGGCASTDNLKARCYQCHKAKTERDRKAGKLTPAPPDDERGPPGR